ncbi:site-specific integrase [Halomonas sp. H33-56]|uniref:tyrosine-type recombinase/integrase n=1 Tax=Halomonas sp. H33-56 TaxID=2950873 RepID=UPI0032DF84DA
MSHTLVVSLSDTVIRRHLADPSVRQLRDPRYPLRLRFNRARTRGSWFVVKHADGRDRWRKVGAFPDLTTKALLGRLPEIQGRLAADPDAAVGVSGWATVADLLTWYRDRVASHGRLSRRRKSAIRTAIDRHLLPRLGEVRLAELTPPIVDDLLVWPMQAEYSLAYVRLVLGVAKGACKQARALGLLEVNPLADVQLSDFLDARVPPKPSRLRADDLPEVLQGMVEAEPMPCLLMLLVLLFGTRINETRLTRWDHLDLEGRTWTIPADHTKSKREHRLPLTNVAVTLLKRYREGQRSTGYRGVHLFPGERGKPVSETTAFGWVAGVSCGDWSSHDLRKLARTIWADLGVDYMVGEVLLNHALSKLDRTYIHTYVERQAEDALKRYHTWLRERGIDALLTETIPRQCLGRDSKPAPWWQGFT